MVTKKFVTALQIILFSFLFSACDRNPNAAEEAFAYSQPPDFSSIGDVKQKKAAFFEYMLPQIQHENARILGVREQLASLQPSAKTGLSAQEQSFVHRLAKKYNVNPAKYKGDGDVIAALLHKIDVVPASLALAQSANESAWGTSRFAKQGNNYYGQWCYSKGCGIVPKHRNQGAKHEVATFKNVHRSTVAYIHNINSHNAYNKLRSLRATQRQAGEVISGKSLALGLQKYSERGSEYVKEIQAMIRVNKLSQYDH